MKKHNAHQDQQVNQKTRPKKWETVFSIIKFILVWIYRIWLLLRMLEGTERGDE
ncbi:hypothetical protein Xhom_00167 [Xenorhabdus hominickii]|uniref:Uncharacterized protein n=1 Tax=Xenorhabdus hominickii TaxID=351679 RepID=A0A2G0QD90_XENHO|nr:hypothetical protein Xhom_02168 [Xenorhabdus hominickii]PHM57205.1 hypothetical protein Xhom_00167 [Xenorhabdus hominickii]